jgi:hypothetical protein
MSKKHTPDLSDWTNSLPAFQPRHEGARDSSNWDELIRLNYSIHVPTSVELHNITLKFKTDLEELNETAKWSSENKIIYDNSVAQGINEDSLDAEAKRAMKRTFLLIAAEKLKAEIVTEEIPAVEFEKAEPPMNAEFLVGLFTKRGYREALLQALGEDFDRNLAAGMSTRRARLRYWAAALSSIVPQLLAAIKRIGLVGLVFDYARRWMG